MLTALARHTRGQSTSPARGIASGYIPWLLRNRSICNKKKKEVIINSVLSTMGVVMLSQTLSALRPYPFITFNTATFIQQIKSHDKIV